MEPRARPDPAFALLGLYETALPEVYGYLLSRCGDRTPAEELTSETFLGAVAACRNHGPAVRVERGLRRQPGHRILALGTATRVK